MLIVAHGERRAGARNVSLIEHAAALRGRLPAVTVAAAVLFGEPSLADAWPRIARSGAARLLIYPLLMSDGYYLTSVLSERLDEARIGARITMLPPLGLDPRFAEVVVGASATAARRAGLEPSLTHLLLAAHGSRKSAAPADAAVAIAGRVARANVFASLSTAFIEQTPLLASELAAQTRPVVVAGLFAGDGLHSSQDIPAAIEETGVRAVYAGPIGAHAQVADVIAEAVQRERERAR